MSVDLQSKSGITQMYEQYFPKIYNFVYYRVYDHEICGDIVSEVFLKVLEHAREYNPQKAGFATWIYTIARHVVIDYYRRKKQAEGNMEDFMDSLAFSLDFEEAYRIYMEEQGGELDALLSILNETEQSVIHLRYFEGLSGRETAEELHINPSTERTLHERALKKMLRFLEKQGITYEDVV